MSLPAILFGLSVALLYIAVRIEFAKLRDLCRRVAEHLNAECHTGIKDIETHRALAAECERAGWGEEGNER